MFTGNYVRIRDILQIEISSKDGRTIKDSLMPSLNQAGQSTGLIARFAATHAGIVNRNHMFYIPNLVRDGTKTFTENFAKPILINHNEAGDPIGRAIAAEYIDLSQSVRDSYKNSNIRDYLDRSFDKLIQDFCAGNISYDQQVEVIRDILSKNVCDGKSILSDPNFQGFGYIDLTAKITDPDAIAKFLDGRYLTGSVGAATNRAVCSECKQNWTKEGPCKHRPGKVYDSREMFLIAGDFEYEEYSVANVPADNKSTVLELFFNGQSHAISGINDSLDSVYELNSKDSINIQEDKSMEKKEEPGKVQDSTVSATVVVTDAKLVEPLAKTPVETPVETVAPVETKVEPVQTTTAVADSKVITEPAKEETIEDTVTRLFDATSLSDEDENKFYDLLWKEIEDAAKEGELSQADIKDAKLSTEQRKKMATSTFCGPNRSFPVPDCAHVTAARRLIGRYKGPGDKTKILACVTRKAKAMGCDSKKKTKDNLTHTRMLHILTSAIEENLYAKMSIGDDGKEPPLSDEDMSLLSGILENLSGMVGKDNLTRILSGDKSPIKDSMKTFQDLSLLDAIISLEENLGSSKEELEKITESQGALREEYGLLQQDVDHLRDELISEKSKTKEARIARLSILMSLKDNKAVEKDELVKLSDEVLESELEKFGNDVDIKRITDKLFNGMSRIPTGKVEDPTGIYDKKTTEIDGVKVVAELERINQTYTAMKFKNSRMADLWLNNEMARMKKEGKIPNEDK